MPPCSHHLLAYCTAQLKWKVNKIPLIANSKASTSSKAVTVLSGHKLVSHDDRVFSHTSIMAKLVCQSAFSSIRHVVMSLYMIFGFYIFIITLMKQHKYSVLWIQSHCYIRIPVKSALNYTLKKQVLTVIELISPSEALPTFEWINIWPGMAL